MVVEQNSRGRIMVDTFEIKRIAVNHIKDNYSQFECIDVKINNPQMELTLRARTDYKIELLDEMRNDIIAMFKQRVHFDIKQLDLAIL
ncbi:hypothetical protein R2F61_00660 [Mollicutes bacterium LVI A0078]|nr:hypothetical protein RZE84_00665 [Mollicutes bacterium LVI A0075]WOO91092.1 hypothetical protein R2F61_00660 [Mollicutes bacterium LVI A0078]